VTAVKLPSATGASSSPAGRILYLLTSEWTKLRSVRSTFWTLLITAVTAIGGSVILAFSSASDGKTPFDQVASIYLAWLEYPVLAIGILGVLAFTSEFSTARSERRSPPCPGAVRCWPPRSAS
jgi:ABC-2 type transport system permease protein